MKFIFILVLFFVTTEAINQNIRHGKSRARLLRNSRHGEEIHHEIETYTLADFNDDEEIQVTAPQVPSTTIAPEGFHSFIERKVTVNGKFSADLPIGDDEAHEEELDEYFNEKNFTIEEEILPAKSGQIDIVTRFLHIVESQHTLGENCTAGTDLSLGEGVVDRYAQERFRVEADVAVNRANMLTRLWKYAEPEVVRSEYLLHASVFSMVEFDDDIFAAGNCYDQNQYKDYVLFCPYAYRLPGGNVLVKDLAIEYKYLSNTSEWFYIARKNAENVIKNYKQFSRGKCSG